EKVAFLAGHLAGKATFSPEQHPRSLRRSLALRRFRSSTKIFSGPVEVPVKPLWPGAKQSKLRRGGTKHRCPPVVPAGFIRISPYRREERQRHDQRPTSVTDMSTRRRERRQGPALFRGRLVPDTTHDERLLDNRGPAEWLHMDPWRVMRIQAEFVEGFGALAELPPAVTVFGS